MTTRTPRLGPRWSLITLPRSPAATGCCQAGAGFGALALGDLLSREASAERRAPRATSRRVVPGWRRPATARSVIFLFMEGGPSHIDTFDPKPALEPAGRQAAAAELQAGDHADGRGPLAASWPRSGTWKQHGAERDLGLGLAAAHRHLRRRPGGDPLVLVQRAEPRRRRLPDEHRLDPGRPALAGKLGELRPGDREPEPARLSS